MSPPTKRATPPDLNKLYRSEIIIYSFPIVVHLLITLLFISHLINYEFSFFNCHTESVGNLKLFRRKCHQNVYSSSASTFYLSSILLIPLFESVSQISDAIHLFCTLLSKCSEYTKKLLAYASYLICGV